MRRLSSLTVSVALVFTCSISRPISRFSSDTSFTIASRSACSAAMFAPSKAYAAKTPGEALPFRSRRNRGRGTAQRRPRKSRTRRRGARHERDDQRQREEDEKDEEQDLRDLGGCDGDAGKAQDARHDGNDEKYRSPIQHG